MEHGRKNEVAIGPYNRAGMFAVFAPLYAGPFISGLALHDWRTVPVFALFFLLFLKSSRKLNLHEPAGWASLVVLTGLQMVIVLGAFGLGRLMAMVFSPIDLPLWMPVAMSGLAASYGVWSYSASREMDVFLDNAIAKIAALDAKLNDDFQAFHPKPSNHVADAVERALTDLRALPETAWAGEMDPIVAQLATRAGVEAFDLLYDSAGDEGNGSDRRVDLALLRFTALPRIERALLSRGEAGLAPMLMLNAPDASVRAEARARLLHLIEDGAPAEQLPDPTWLSELNEDYPGEDYGGLRLKREALSKGDKTG